MDEKTVSSLEDIWPLQAALNARAGLDTQALGSALAAAEASGELPAAGGVRLEVGRALR